MKSYWDSSALVETVVSAGLRLRLQQEGGLTRSHSLAEMFSVLTGGANLKIRVGADQAAETLEELARDLSFCDLTPGDTVAALKKAKAKGVRGGRVHDFLHAVAAEKSGARKLLTLDQNDFDGLTALDIEKV